MALNNANSNKSPEEKEKGKINIINDINNILDGERKTKLLDIIKKIL